MNKNEFSFKSATGVCKIYACRYTPDDENVKAVVIIHHGMAEYQARYENFLKYLTSCGYAVYMHDMANHGKSNSDYSLTGYFGKKDGYKGLVDDLYTVFKRACEEYPNKKIIMFGHSMGSFVTRCFTAWYANAGFSGAIYMGTGGSNPIAPFGDKISAVVSALTGRTRKSRFLDNLSFSKYNEKFENRTGLEWLTRDEKIVDKYVDDKYCGFMFSAQGMNDLVKLNRASNSDDWYAKVKSDLPILLISGAMDPVGDYTNGIKEIEGKLKSSGHTNVSVKLYDGARHELLNEINKNDIYKDITDWIENSVL